MHCVFFSIIHAKVKIVTKDGTCCGRGNAIRDARHLVVELAVPYVGKSLK